MLHHCHIFMTLLIEKGSSMSIESGISEGTIVPHQSFNDRRDQDDLPVDLSQLPAIHLSKSLLLVNNFVANTTRFLNHFAYECEERLNKVATNLTRVEILLALLEAKLNSIPDLVIPESVEMSASIAIDDEHLPSADAGLQVSSTSLVPSISEQASLSLPISHPLPDLPSLIPDILQENNEAEDPGNAIVVASEETSAIDQPLSQNKFFLKLKDDPVYANYFTMRRLGMPDGAVAQKMIMDGVDSSILSMDPEGPSPGMERSATHFRPAPSTIFSDSDDEDGFVVPDSRIPHVSANSPTNSVASSAFSMAPPPPSLPSVSQLHENTLSLESDDNSSVDSNRSSATSDDFSDDRSSFPAPIISSTGIQSDTGDSTALKLKDEPVFSKYFTMQKMGLPEGAIRQKMHMDGVNFDILGMDPNGPSPNAGTARASPSLPLEQELPTQSALPPPPKPDFKKYDSVDDFDSD
uniref:Uncharacterized protein AlNc14C121G6687 n=1 Tax=Albugo laibachii Nc14 TaxID=890382 RepID=F0WJF8_9STRA|nr:conserved hypothetical protein [Albugo laibachii Nc14]|eukprot:CCA21407.1 conserved hypothetical protein [Albugo laibachii Nc14]